MEKWIEKRKIFKGKTFTLFSGKIVSDNGDIFQRDVVDHPGGVAVVPLIGDSIVFVKQYRIAIKKEIVEIPAGVIEKNEKPKNAAKRELKEETGYITDQLTHLTSFFVSVGYTTEKIHVYMAENMIQSNQKLDLDENISILKIKISKIPDLLKKKWFEDSKTIIGLQYFLSRHNDGK